MEISENHYYNTQPPISGSLVHKWTINNFENFYHDEWKIDRIESDKFHSSSNEVHQFNLCLFLNDNQCKSNLKILLCHFSSDNVDLSVRFKISIIDENGEKRNTRDLQCTFKEEEMAWGFDDYISISQLLDNSSGLLSDGSLTLLCEIQILDNKVQKSITNLSINLLHLTINKMNQLNGSVRLKKFAHKWTIHNFACALADESSGDELISCRFSSSNSKDFQFYLSIFPKGFDEDDRNYVSMRLFVYLFKKMQLTFRYSISLIIANGKKLKSIGGEKSVDEPSYVLINKFISHNDLHQQLLNDNVLRLYCEIEVIQNCGLNELSKMIKAEYLHCLSKLKLDNNEVTETVTNAKEKKIKFEFIWEIENCVKTSDQDASSLFTSHPTSFYIESPTFSPPNHSSTHQHLFYLRMYPNGQNEQFKDYVSMFLGVHTFEKREITCQFKISLIYYIHNCKYKFNTKEIRFRYINNLTFGFVEFISHSDLFDSNNALIINNKLIVHCEIEFVDEEMIGEIRNNSNELYENNNQVENIKPNPTFTPTKSITQVTLHTHHWTIDNFNLYFKSIQDDSSYLKSTPFCLTSNDQTIHLILRLHPKEKTNQLSINFGLSCNRTQKPLALVHISVLDENDRKCYTKTFRIDSRYGYGYLSWTDIQLNPNAVKQFKLLIQYQLCTHYSSTTEMSHLDQFSLDLFTSPWQVKRLCHVPTHSRALTSIPVESCHFEWSIHEFSSQEKFVQSRNFTFTENDQLQFYFQINLHSKDKISIELCLEKYVEKETRIIVTIAILDKDGHKCCTRECLVKLLECELEYECAEFENDNFSNNALLLDDTLRMCCELKLIGDATCSSQMVKSIPKVLPRNEFLTNRQPSDVVFQFSNGNQLHAHRSILSARSPVFEKMFEHDTMEAQHGQVDITDMDMEVCELMLQYIYTGLVELDQTWALELMMAADKYSLIELKNQCEDWLCTNLCIESVTDCLVWSDQIGATRLKSKSIQYFHRNSIAISQTDAITEIIKNRPNLMLELYLNSTRDLNNKIGVNLIVEDEEKEDDNEERDISVL